MSLKPEDIKRAVGELTQKQLNYLMAAHRKMRQMLVDEEEADREYHDLAVMLEMSGSEVISKMVRSVQADEQKHARWFKEAVDVLNRVIIKFEQQPKGQGNFKDKVWDRTRV